MIDLLVIIVSLMAGSAAYAHGSQMAWLVLLISLGVALLCRPRIGCFPAVLIVALSAQRPPVIRQSEFVLAHDGQPRTSAALDVPARVSCLDFLGGRVAEARPDSETVPCTVGNRQSELDKLLGGIQTVSAAGTSKECIGSGEGRKVVGRGIRSEACRSRSRRAATH